MENQEPREFLDRVVDSLCHLFGDNVRGGSLNAIEKLQELNNGILQKVKHIKAKSISSAVDSTQKKDVGELSKIAARSSQKRAAESNLNITKEEPPVEKVPSSFKDQLVFILSAFWSMFSDTYPSERILLFIGILCAFLHGVTYPILAYFFGTMSKKFYSGQLLALNRSSMLDFNSSTHSEFDSGYTKEEFTMDVSKYSYYYFYMALWVFIVAFIQTLTWEWVAENRLYGNRVWFISELCREELSWIYKKGVGNFIFTLSDDLEKEREGTGHNFSMLFEYFGIFVCGAGIGILTNQKLALIFLTSVPVYITRYLIVGKMLVAKNKLLRKQAGEARSISNEILHGISAVQACAAEELEAKRYWNQLEKVNAEYSKIFHLNGLSMAILFILAYGVYALGFYYAIKLVLDGSETPGDVYMVLFSVTISLFAVTNCFPFLSSVTTAKSSNLASRNIFQTIRKINPYSNESTEIIPSKSEGQIIFHDISHKFSSIAGGFERLNIEVRPRQSVVIVGPDSVGKDALIHLVLRFFDPEKGYISYDNNDLKDLNLHWFRQQIAVAPQYPNFFALRVMDNIVCDTIPEKNTKEFNEIFDWVVECAKIACVHDEIMSLESEYFTKMEIADKMFPMSFRQRLGVVRGLAQRPKVLIINNALSTLDIKVANKIFYNISKCRSEMSFIGITTKAMTALSKFVDYVYVMKDNKIVEKGTLAELKKPGTQFETMLRKEYPDYDKMEATTLPSNEEHEAGEIPTDDEGSNGEADFLGFYDESIQAEDTTSRVENTHTIDNTNFSEKSLLLGERNKKDVEKTVPVDLLQGNFSGIVKYFKEQKWMFLFGLFGCIVAGAVEPLMAYILGGNIFSAVMKVKDESDGEVIGIIWASMIVLLGVVAGLGQWARTIFLSLGSQSLASVLRFQAFSNLLKQQLSWFREHGPLVKLQSRISCSIPLIQTAFGSRFGLALSPLFSFLIVVIITSNYSWELGLSALVVFPFILIVFGFQIKTQLLRYQKMAKLHENILQQLIKAIDGIWDIQAYSTALVVCRDFDKDFLIALRKGRKQLIIYAFAVGLIQFVFFIVFGSLFAFAAYLVNADKLAPSSFFTIFFVLVFTSLSLGLTTTHIGNLSKGILGAQLVLPIIDVESPLDTLDPTLIQPKIDGTIEFRNVSFSYPDTNTRVLNNLSLIIKKNKSTGIVANVGGGRTTIFKLIERFHDLERGMGKILIDGCDIRNIQLSYLRSKIGYVPEFALIFDRTIAENIAYGKHDYSEAEVQHFIRLAARDSRAIEFIEVLKEQFEFKCGEMGAFLTSGEKQLLSVARAIFRQPPILLLDDPTSTLDDEEEENFITAMKDVMKDRTVLICSNSPQLIEKCDKIVVIDGGQVVQAGTHDELLQDDNELYKIFVSHVGPGRK